jgi:hypothetical protein
MKNLKDIAIAIGIIIAIFLSGIFVGRFYFAKTEIKVVERLIYKTIYKEKIQPVFDQDNFNRLLACYNSELKFKDRTENNYLFVTALDDCKEATARYEIGQSGSWKIYAGVGLVGILAGGYLSYKYLR